MTDWEVERDERAAYRSVIAHGASPLMPSQSQGAERRPERRAGRRWALRALVVGGLAGAAWLLTGAAAHAADHDAEPVGSVLGSTLDRVASVSGSEPAVGELLKAAVQPLESAPKIHRRAASSSAVTSILTAPERVLSGPVETLDEVVHDGSAIGAETVDTVLRTASAPPRTSGEIADDQSRTASADIAADPVTEPALAEPTPVAERPHPPAIDGTARVTPAEQPAQASTSTIASRARAGVMPVRYAEATSRSHVHRYVPAARPTVPETIRENLPVDDGPAPMRMNLGAVSGIPAGGPGASPEFGSAAVLPARFANVAVRNQLRPLAADVEVRRHDAEAPTVSPD